MISGYGSLVMSRYAFFLEDFFYSSCMKYLTDEEIEVVVDFGYLSRVRMMSV